MNKRHEGKGQNEEMDVFQNAMGIVGCDECWQTLCMHISSGMHVLLDLAWIAPIV